MNFFIKNNLWNEARVLVGNKQFKEGVKAPYINKNNSIISSINQDKLHTFYNDWYFIDYRNIFFNVNAV